MNLLDRLLGHDLATTEALLRLSSELPEEKMDTPVDAGWGTLRKTFAHMIGNIEGWTDLMMERPVRETSGDSVGQLLQRLQQSYGEFATFALQVEREGRLDNLFTDALDNPPRQKSLGGAIGHVITHNMHHRSEILHMLHRLGAQNIPEGDLMGWDQRQRIG
jgi:uncharacterized damage-inducible protein DinB